MLARSKGHIARAPGVGMLRFAVVARLLFGDRSTMENPGSEPAPTAGKMPRLLQFKHRVVSCVGGLLCAGCCFVLCAGLFLSAVGVVSNPCPKFSIENEHTPSLAAGTELMKSVQRWFKDGSKCKYVYMLWAPGGKSQVQLLP